MSREEAFRDSQLILWWNVAFQEHIIVQIVEKKSRDSSVGIALGYGLVDRGSRVRFPAEGGNYSLHRRVQTVSRAHPPSYPMCIGSSFPGGKAVGA
jgi:hypothetical protein